jgi:predicted ATPase/DNA-binding SARP family transcriptional activator
VLAALAVHAGRVVGAGALMEVLWDDAPPPSAAHTLQGLVSRLRGVLGADAIVAQTPGYLLSAELVRTDGECFEQLAHKARTSAGQGAAAVALDEFDAALRLWRGRAYEEFADRSFAQSEAARLEELRAALVEDRADLLLATRPLAQIVGELEAAANAEPYRERRQGHLMMALARSGRPVDAMRSYERFRRRLVDEVGVVPGRSLQRLNDAILRQAPGTEWTYSGPDGQESGAIASAGLPRPMTSFVGRADELAALASDMRKGGLTTLCGPGGVGKTRLAVETARALNAGTQPVDGVCWCDLAAIGSDLPADCTDVVSLAVGAALGASPEHGQRLRDRIPAFLAGKRLVLVIDNCDHVVEAVADLVAAVLQRAPEVAVLATSREPLAIDGERIIDVDPLGVDDAIRLFTDRAASVRRGFALTPDNAATVVDICRHLDGIPLALELAAGRLTSLGVVDVARLLDDRFTVLVSSRRDATDRHRTLRAAMDSSYASLSSAEQAVFGRLGVFPESFALDAAEAVCAEESITPTDVLEILSHLVARSLVVAESDNRGAVRYRLLETLRVYARERLAERGDASLESTHRRHATHYATVVAQAATGITGSNETRWLGWLVDEISNLRAAVHWACGSADLDLAAGLFAPLHPWIWCGDVRTTEIGRWAALLVQMPAIEQHPAYTSVCEWGLRSRGRTSGDDRSDIVDWVARVTAPEFSHSAVTLGCLAFAEMATNPRTATEMFLRATEMARVAGDHLTEVAHLTVLVNMPRRVLLPPEPEVAERSARCLAAARATGSPTTIAWALLNVALTLNNAADRQLAEAALDELDAVVVRCAFPDSNLENGAEYVRALARLAQGDLAALGALRAEIYVKSTNGYRSMLAVHLLRLAQVFVHFGECLVEATELIAGVRRHDVFFTEVAEETTEILRSRLGDDTYESAVRRGESLTLEQLAQQALLAIDRLLPRSSP